MRKHLISVREPVNHLDLNAVAGAIRCIYVAGRPVCTVQRRVQYMKCSECGSAKLGLSQIVVVLHDIVESSARSVTLDGGLVEWDTGRDRGVRCHDCGHEFDLDASIKVNYSADAFHCHHTRAKPRTKKGK
jgi:hypothetical protein